MPSPASPTRPFCFVAVPNGKRTDSADAPPAIAVDAVFQAMAASIEGLGLACRRADFDPSGGFSHRAMFESLLIADYVVVDLTSANASVAYQVGLRHGANAGHGTILVCEETALRFLPFDARPMHPLPYRLSDLGTLGDRLAGRLREAMAGRLPQAPPILQITNLHPSTSAHEKTDLFAQRMAHASEVGAQVSSILERADNARAIAELQALEAKVLDAAPAIEQLHTALLAIYLGYRAKKAWTAMVALFGRMPGELQASPVAREQLALAHNRIAEGSQDPSACHEERQQAILALEAIAKPNWTSETYGILGRIRKGQADAERAAGREAESRAALSAAIKAYESGFGADPRDYYPGVNAVTLRILRNQPEDEPALSILLPAVRFSVGRAPAPQDQDEVYWQAATRLELAAGARDWTAAQSALDDVLAVEVAHWMRESTAANLERQARARANEPATQTALNKYVEALGASRAGR